MVTGFFKGIFWLSLIAVTYLALTPSPEPALSTSWDKLDHCAAFLFLFLALDQGWPRAWPMAHKLVALLAYGIGIEAIQSLIPGRYASGLDVVADAIGLIMYLGIKPLLSRYGRRLQLQ